MGLPFLLSLRSQYELGVAQHRYAGSQAQVQDSEVTSVFQITVYGAELRRFGVLSVDRRVLELLQICSDTKTLS